MNTADLNVWAVLVATLTTMVLGFLWYSPALFGNAWMKQIGLKKEDISGGSPLTYVFTALTALGGAFILALLFTMSDDQTIGTGVALGLLVGLSIALKVGMNYLFESRTFKLFLITSGYHLVSYAIAGIVIGAM